LNVWKAVWLSAGAVVLLTAIAVAGALAWFISGDASRPAAETKIVIPDGSGAAEIGRLLESDGIVRSGRLFWWYVRVRGGGDRIEAAQYDFPAHQTLPQVVTRLLAGGTPPVTWVTIPEGFTSVQIARRLSTARLTSVNGFLAVVRSDRLRFDGQSTDGLEGYLFPDTYQVPRRADAEAIARLMTDRFMAELPGNPLAAAKRLGFSIPQIVTIASMIEREGKIDAERPLIASVIYNRLHRGMPLEIDATIEYALPHHKAELSLRDLAIDSPYNTYQHAGLPPTPISNPGKASLDAAFHPAQTPYLYYVYRGGGRHAFSTTLEQQQENERRYLH
jgi:UPF0755 protein